jgi:hypothetical protein
MQNLAVKAVSAQTEPELLGWFVRQSPLPEDVPATTVVHTKAGAGAQNFLTLFIPIKPGDPEPIKSVQSEGENAAIVALADGRKLSISADPDPAGDLELRETLSSGAPGRHVKSK